MAQESISLSSGGAKIWGEAPTPADSDVDLLLELAGLLIVWIVRPAAVNNPVMSTSIRARIEWNDGKIIILCFSKRMCGVGFLLRRQSRLIVTLFR